MLITVKGKAPAQGGRLGSGTLQERMHADAIKGDALIYSWLRGIPT
jgi:hypothetical protein